MFLYPVVLGGGTAFLPEGVRLDLELLDERRFDHGVVFLRYAVRDGALSGIRAPLPVGADRWEHLTRGDRRVAAVAYPRTGAGSGSR